MKKFIETLNSSAGIYSVRVNWLWGISFLGSYAFILDTSPGKGILVIDTGCRGSGKIIADAMKDIGLSPADIKGIALSHWHRDHTGGAAELLSIAREEGASGIRVFIHKDDSKYFPGGSSAFIRFHPFLKIPMHHSQGQIPDRGLCEFVELDEGSPVNPLIDWGLDFIHVPGHTPGSICFCHGETGSLFSGSGLALLDSGRVGIMSVFDDRAEQLASAERLAAMNFRYLYPAHLGIRKDPVPPDCRIPAGRISVMDRIRGIRPLFRYR